MDQQDKSVRRRPAKSTSDQTPEPRTSEIRAEIEETRAEIGETVEAIQDRLRPGAVVSRAATTIRDAAIEKARHMTGRSSWEDRTPRRAGDWYYGDGVLDRIREHPVPAALAAASLAWLAFAKRPSRDYEGPPYGGTWSEPDSPNVDSGDVDHDDRAASAVGGYGRRQPAMASNAVNRVQTWAGERGKECGG